MPIQWEGHPGLSADVPLASCDHARDAKNQLSVAIPLALALV